MPDCCNPSGYEQYFSPKEAKRNLRAYDRKGLNKMARRTVDYLRSAGVEGDTVLEVGGGIGAVHVELLKAGANRAINVELSRGYQEVAAELLRREGLEGRVEQRIGDFTEIVNGIKADDVVMNRVICCYPDMERLMTAAMASSRRFVTVIFPRGRATFRLFVGIGNFYYRMRRMDFRAFIHPPQAILDTARRGGFDVVFSDQDLVWHGVVFRRDA